MRYEMYTPIKLKDGRVASIVDCLGPDYVVDVGKDETDWDTIIVKEEEIEGMIE